MSRKLSPLETKILNELSEDNLMNHVLEISKFERMTGSEDEARALDYVAKTFEGYDVKQERYHYDAYVGQPESAEVEVGAPVQKVLTGTPSALAPPCPEGVKAKLIYLGSGGEDSFAQTDVRGKLVLVEGIAEPEIAKRADTNGALGEIFINDENPHEGTVSVVWGSPRWETSPLLPATPCVSIAHDDGEFLKALLKKEPIEVTLKARGWRGWRKIPVLIASIPGRTEKRFTLLSGHIDSWYYGSMDNATANAMLLELGRVFSKNRRALRRGLRLAFWSGHSHARFSGSTMYADNHWHELEENCIAHVNADSIGSNGANVLTEAAVMPETFDLANLAVEKVGGQRLSGHPFSRMGDQSFWGIGIPSVFNSLSEISTDSDVKTVSLFGPSPTGIGWWWHTKHDTPDKIDSKVLLRDSKVYALVLLELCADPIIPLNYLNTTRVLENQLASVKVSDSIDLKPVTSRAKELERKLRKLNLEIKTGGGQKHSNSINQALIRLSRILVPIMQTKVGRFDHDLAVSIPNIPCLEQVRKLGDLDQGTDEFKFRTVGARRDLNQLSFALDEAVNAVDTALRELR